MCSTWPPAWAGEDYADLASDVANAGAANGVALADYLAALPREATPGAVFNYHGCHWV